MLLLITNFLVSLEYVQLKTYRNMSHYYHSHRRLSKESLFIRIYQDSLYRPNHLVLASCFQNKHH